MRGANIPVFIHDFLGFMAFCFYIYFAIVGNTHWMIFTGITALGTSIEISFRKAQEGK